MADTIRLRSEPVPWGLDLDSDPSFHLEFDAAHQVVRVMVWAYTQRPRVVEGDSETPFLPASSNTVDHYAQPNTFQQVAIQFAPCLAFRSLPVALLGDASYEEVPEQDGSWGFYRRLDASGLLIGSWEEIGFKCYVLLSGDRMLEVIAKGWKWRVVGRAEFR